MWEKEINWVSAVIQSLLAPRYVKQLWIKDLGTNSQNVFVPLVALRDNCLGFKNLPVLNSK
jgi:hypothetical protein